MRWSLNAKDHSTGPVHLCCLSKNDQNVWSMNLKCFWFHWLSNCFSRDNGNEFTAKETIDWLKDLNTNIFIVTDRIRMPSDQGSVEIAKKHAKCVLSNLEEDECKMGRDPNWTNLLGHIMGAINRQF